MKVGGGKRLEGKKSISIYRLGAKRPGGETSKGQNDLKISPAIYSPNYHVSDDIINSSNLRHDLFEAVAQA